MKGPFKRITDEEMLKSNRCMAIEASVVSDALKRGEKSVVVHGRTFLLEDLRISNTCAEKLEKEFERTLEEINEEIQ